MTTNNGYYVNETNGLMDAAAYHENMDYTRDYTLAELAKAGGKVTRVRLLTEGNAATRTRWADISYIHATLPDGTGVSVNLSNLSQAIGIPYPKIKGLFIEWAKEEGVYAKGIGLLDDSAWSVVR